MRSFILSISCSRWVHYTNSSSRIKFKLKLQVKFICSYIFVMGCYKNLLLSILQKWKNMIQKLLAEDEQLIKILATIIKNNKWSSKYCGNMKYNVFLLSQKTLAKTSFPLSTPTKTNKIKMSGLWSHISLFARWKKVPLFKGARGILPNFSPYVELLISKETVDKWHFNPPPAAPPWKGGHLYPYIHNALLRTNWRIELAGI